MTKRVKLALSPTVPGAQWELLMFHIITKPWISRPARPNAGR